MGIDFTGLRALLFLKRTGSVNFGRVVTLGRHEIFFHEAEFEYLVKRAGVPIPYSAQFSNASFQEPLLEALGAERVESIDASDYEGASLVFDFNGPVPAAHRGRFSTYIDLGSMEHVFDARQVVLNVNHLLEEDGAALILTNANGNAGHGFFQFSPEFFYSAFSPSNGFSGTSVFLINPDNPRTWLAVEPPAALRARNEIPYYRKWYVLCLTRKDRTVDSVSAQQSDYTDVAWDDKAHRHQPDPRGKPYHQLIKLSPFLYMRLRSVYYNARLWKKYGQHAPRFDPETSRAPFRVPRLSKPAQQPVHAG